RAALAARARRWSGACRRPVARSPAPGPRPRRWTGDHVDALALRPQVDHVRLDDREVVDVALDLALFVTREAPGERDLAVRLEQGRIVETGAAGDEAAPGVVGGP